VIRGILARAIVSSVAVLLSVEAAAQQSESDLAKKAQNPVADLISLPFQANTSYRVGPLERTQNVLNIQPVIPVDLNDRWNLITRTIFPIVSQPSFVRGQNRDDGIGDTTISGFLSPKQPAFGRLIWGLGPVVTLPTASDERLGFDQWGTGLTGVALLSEGAVVVGALVNNVFSLEGRSFSQFLLQPFLNYNFPKGWYVSTSPIVTADWSRQDDAWLVPVGGGFGKVHRIGKQPVNLSLQAYYNAEKPQAGGDWSTRLQAVLLFPK
jgi:hypothetical protein